MPEQWRSTLAYEILMPQGPEATQAPRSMRQRRQRWREAGWAVAEMGLKRVRERRWSQAHSGGLSTVTTEGKLMDAAAVQHAVTALKAQGGRVSVRAIHARIGGSFRDLHRLLCDVAAEGDEVEADDEVAGSPDEVSRPLTPLQRAQDAVRALDARAQGLQATEETWLRQRRDLQQTMAQARQSHDLDTLTTLLTREPAVAQILSQVQSETREAWAAVQSARAGVQAVYREASPTAAQYLAVRARIQALQQAMHHHGRELARCQAELPQHQQQLDALGRELRETWGVEEPT